jgi:hypothetical protein
MRCRRRRTSSSAWRQSTKRQSKTPPSGPFTTSTVSPWRPTCPSVSVSLSIQSPQAHPTHVGTLSGPGTRPGSRPVIRNHRRKGRSRVPVSRRLSAYRHWLVGSSCSRLGCAPSSRSAYRSPSMPGPRRGYHVPHARDTTGEGALSTPGRRCSHDRRRISGRRLPLLSGQSCTPAPQPIRRAQPNGASTRVHLRSPVRPSPGL